MARKSIVELTDEAIANLPDNTTGLISAADVRDLIIGFLAAIRPAYATLSRTGGISVTIDVAPELVAFNDAVDSYPAETTSSLPGTITRADPGTSHIFFQCDIAAGTNITFLFELYKNGLATGKAQSITGRGAANPVSISFTAIDYADPAATYQVHVSAESDGQAATLSDIQFILSVATVNSYT